MDSIGAEVGQKMRSAIKAKLLELECYVDDELPDYIMVMVANRRTKSQMNEDLNLFLSTKTSTFVNWLHIVLKKLKEVTVTNPEVYKKAVKRKSGEVPPDDKSALKVKKEKSHKKVKKESLAKVEQEDKTDEPSLTDELPITANKLSENRKIIIENQENDIAEDSFDIPLLSEVGEMNEKELQDIEKKIKSVKSRLGLLVESDAEPDPDIKSEKEIEEENNLARKRQISVLENAVLEQNQEETSDDSLVKSREVELEENEDQDKPKHKRITFDFEPEKSRLDIRRSRSPRTPPPRKKQSVLDRLGKRASPDRFRSDYRDRGRDRRNSRSRDSRRRSSSRDRYQRDRKRSKSRERDRSPVKNRDRSGEGTKKVGILGRLGVQSKVAVVKKPPQKSDSEEETVNREVRSAIKVKPRVLPAAGAQPNKNLLLKAVADAQRSIAQAPKVGKDVPEKLYTKKYSEQRQNSNKNPNKVSFEREKRLPKFVRQQLNNLRNMLQGGGSSDSSSSSEMEKEREEVDLREYVPRAVKLVGRDLPKYVPTSQKSDTESKENATKENDNRQFIITLDGLEKLAYLEAKIANKARLDTNNKKRSPSPIVFDKQKNNSKATLKATRHVPDKLPVVHPPVSLKNKERCRYWPNCRQGDKCEFVHPSENCQMFPLCKFGDKCLYIHPKCKFRTSCTKKDCPYDHADLGSTLGSVVSATQNCKFYPNCANLNCPFFHPKSCKYGKYCKNVKECPFSHGVHKSLTWKANK